MTSSSSPSGSSSASRCLGMDGRPIPLRDAEGLPYNPIEAALLLVESAVGELPPDVAETYLETVIDRAIEVEDAGIAAGLFGLALDRANHRGVRERRGPGRPARPLRRGQPERPEPGDPRLVPGPSRAPRRPCWRARPGARSPARPPRDPRPAPAGQRHGSRPVRSGDAATTPATHGSTASDERARPAGRRGGRDHLRRRLPGDGHRPALVHAAGHRRHRLHDRPAPGHRPGRRAAGCRARRSADMDRGPARPAGRPRGPRRRAVHRRDQRRRRPERLDRHRASWPRCTRSRRRSWPCPSSASGCAGRRSRRSRWPSSGTALLAGVAPEADAGLGVAAALAAAVLFGLYIVLARRWAVPYRLDGTLVTIANLIGRGPVLLLVEALRSPATLVPTRPGAGGGRGPPDHRHRLRARRPTCCSWPASVACPRAGRPRPCCSPRSRRPSSGRSCCPTTSPRSSSSGPALILVGIAVASGVLGRPRDPPPATPPRTAQGGG